jgi:hypothetical protein
MATEQQKGTFAVKVGLAQVRRPSHARVAFHRRAPAESPPATIARFGKSGCRRCVTAAPARAPPDHLAPSRRPDCGADASRGHECAFGLP